MTTLPISVCRVHTEEGPKDYFTCLSPERVFARGLPREAVIGVLLRPLAPGEAITPAVFARNRVFVDFMHDVIARRCPQLAGFIAEARRQGQGCVFVIDQRTGTPQAAVPPQDIVGGFQIQNGTVVPDSYLPNPNHMVLSLDGFFQLGPELEPCLMEELVNLAGER